MDFSVDPNYRPQWQTQHPESMLAKILALKDQLKARDVLNMIFEYSEYAERNQFIIVDRSQFEDGRYRVFAHPDHQDVIERALSLAWERRNTP